MFQTKVVEKNKTHILCSVTFSKIASFVRESRKTFLQAGRPPMTMWRMHIACSILNATNTHSEYVIFIAFQLQ
jgi:hypothetical protein